MLALRLFLYEHRNSAYFCIKHVDTEVTKCRFEEVILGTVFQQRAIHGVGSNLKKMANMIQIQDFNITVQ